jgi:GT2 family glycosyltransferase
MPDVSIIIVNWNTREYLADCLQSLSPASSSVACEIIVVDNASADGSVEMCASRFPHVKVIENTENIGFGRANNHGVAMSSAAFCWLLNSDTIINSGCIEATHAAMTADPSIAVVGCRLLNKDGSVQLSCMRFPTLWRLVLQESLLYRLFPSSQRLFVEPPFVSERIHCDWVFGAAMLVRKSAFEAIGGFDPRIWMYGEEMELCYRLKRAGGIILFEPGGSVMHYGEGSWRGDAARPILLRQRGLVHFYRQHHSALLANLAWIVLTLGTILRSLGWLGWTLTRILDPAARRAGFNRTRTYLSVLGGLLNPFAKNVPVRS